MQVVSNDAVVRVCGLAMIFDEHLRRKILCVWAIFSNPAFAAYSSWQPMRVVSAKVLQRFLSAQGPSVAALVRRVARDEVSRPYVHQGVVVDGEPEILVTPPSLVGHVMRPEDPRPPTIDFATIEILDWVVNHHQAYVSAQVSTVLRNLSLHSTGALQAI